MYGIYLKLKNRIRLNNKWQWDRYHLHTRYKCRPARTDKYIALILHDCEPAGTLAIDSANICKAFGHTMICLAPMVTGMCNETIYFQNNTFSYRETHKFFAILLDRSEPGLHVDKRKSTFGRAFATNHMFAGRVLRCDWLFYRFHFHLSHSAL